MSKKKDELEKIEELDVQGLSDEELESVAGGAEAATDVVSCSCSCCAATATNQTQSPSLDPSGG
ncbi:MAG TPA: hypothetical protein VHM02_14250 [Thermoanaerobaculia bacterium]|nr:hypothetical protein [Thermoanaerobaculia bacterium]